MQNVINVKKLVVAAFGALILGSAIGASDHHHHKASNERASHHMAKPEKKWETDEALRHGMDNIRHAFMQNAAAIRQDRLSTREYGRLAENVERNLNDIVTNCKLPPEADKALHDVVLVDLIHGSEQMRTSKKRSVQRANATAILQSLRLYGEHFNHPGWEIDTKVN